MHLKKTYAVAAAAVMSALSVLLLLVGTLISPNTLFFSALAAYLIGYTVNKYGLKYGCAQLVVCVLLDFFVNPNKLNWILYLCLGGYIFVGEAIFQKWNRVRDERKRFRVQLMCNWILFNMIYIPLLTMCRGLLFSEDVSVGFAVLWFAGQVGWFLYDKAYRFFFRTLRDRNL